MSARATRRHLFSASAAAVVLFGAAGAAKAVELDGVLLKRVAELEAVQARLDVLNAGPDDVDDLFRDALDEFWAVASLIAETPARTPEGLAAKARTLRLVHRSLTSSEEGHIARHVLGLVRDMVGEG